MPREATAGLPQRNHCRIEQKRSTRRSGQPYVEKQTEQTDTSGSPSPDYRFRQYKQCSSTADRRFLAATCRTAPTNRRRAVDNSRLHNGWPRASRIGIREDSSRNYSRDGIAHQQFCWRSPHTIAPRRPGWRTLRPARRVGQRGHQRENAPTWRTWGVGAGAERRPTRWRRTGRVRSS